jgi:integrase
MSLFKRDKTWWTDFSVNGVRYRISLNTTDWREAQSREKEKITQASTGKLAPSSQKFARLAFTEAADRYLESRKLEILAASLEKEKWVLLHPRKFFGTTQLYRIASEDLRAYREQRAADGRAASYINMEMGAIRRILKRARRWYLVGEDLKPLKERRGIGRALSPEQKAELLRVAASRPDWLVAYYAAVLVLNTTLRGGELKSLRWRNVDLIGASLVVNTSKTEAGERVIPLNAEAMKAMLELYKRSESLNAALLDHYVFPACENGKINPVRPQKSWRTAWRHLTNGIYCPTCAQFQKPGETCVREKCKADIRKIKSPIAGLRFHDLRHHAITELAEGQASDQVIRSIAGHVSQRMLEHYSHVRIDAKRKALEALCGTSGYGTNNVTNSASPVPANPQGVDKNGRPVGTRTPDLYRVKVAL